MPADKTIDTVLMILAIGALTLGLGSMLLGWLVGQWDQLLGRFQNSMREPEPRRSNAFPLPNGVEPDEPRSLFTGELLLNATEVIAVARMIDHNRTAAKPSKSSTIAAGFGVSRGGSAAYVRASLIYDTLFGVPAPVGAAYRQPDGTTAPASRPVSSQR